MARGAGKTFVGVCCRAGQASLVALDAGSALKCEAVEAAGANCGGTARAATNRTQDWYAADCCSCEIGVGALKTSSTQQ